MADLLNLRQWRPPDSWQAMEVLDMHTAGEPLRIVLSGFPLPPGRTIGERRRTCQARSEELRTALLWEPRGHADQYGCLIVPAEREDSDFGVLFLHNAGYSTMCGHAIIAVARAAVLCGLVPATGELTKLKIDTPAGLVRAQVQTRGPGAPSVSFVNVPAFVEKLDLEVAVADLGSVRCDVAFGGAYYAFVDADSLGLELVPASTARLIQAGTAVKAAVSDACPLRHPDDPDLGFLYGTIFTGTDPDGSWRNVCVFADGQIDRSPTGTGVSARLAVAHARGSIGVGSPQRFTSLIDTAFQGEVLEVLSGQSGNRVLTRVSGTAHVTGRASLLREPDDPLRDGFFLR